MKIVFQGGSLTECNRKKEDPFDIGDGYVAKAAEFLRETYPNVEFTFINRGVSGDRTWDLLKRWQRDVIDLQPDILTLLIGINDTWRRYDQNDPTSLEEYEHNLRTLLEDVKANTNAKILMIEPFLVDMDDTLPHIVDKNMHAWREDFDPKIQVFRRMAYEYADGFLPMDGIMAMMCAELSVKYFSVDGIHLIEPGCAAMGGFVADALRRIIDTILEERHV